MKSQHSKFRYVILPVRPSMDFYRRDLVNIAYDFWKEYWVRTFQRKAPDFWNPLDFFRQDLVFCLFIDGEIVAQNLSTFLHIDDHITSDLEYFEAFKGDALEMIRQEKAKSILTIEYTAVHRNFGERKIGYRLAEVMNNLASKYFLSLDMDVSTGTPRTSSGLSAMASSNGYRKVREGLEKAGWILDSFIGFKDELHDHPDPVYRDLIEYIWATRNDLSQSQSRLVKQKSINPSGIPAATPIEMDNAHEQLT